MKCYYQILITSHGKQLQFIKSFHKVEQANKYFHKMLEENKKIIFPVRYINKRKIMEAKYELVIIKRKDENEDEITKLRNDYGEFVNYQTNNEEWIVYDKQPYDFEETFWIYGFHPLNLRKSYEYIFNELVYPKVTNKYDFPQIIVYLNKLIIKSYNKTDMIICKNKSDCIRLYNKIEDDFNKNKKCKYCFFCGNWSKGKKLREEAFKIVQDLTNWDRLKINRTSTRP